MIDSVIFDAEGVVIDTEGHWDRAQRELLARRGIVYDRGLLKPLLTGRSSLEGARVVCEVLRLDEGPEEIASERTEIMKELLGGGVDFVPGFLDFFERVSGRLNTSVATAMDPVLLAMTDAVLGLSERFGGRIVTLADVAQVGKPAPDLFLRACSLMGSRPAACLVIEDAPLGVEAARRAGMRSIGLATTHPAERLAAADQVCGAFDEIDLPLHSGPIVRESA